MNKQVRTEKLIVEIKAFFEGTKINGNYIMDTIDRLTTGSSSRGLSYRPRETGGSTGTMPPCTPLPLLLNTSLPRASGSSGTDPTAQIWHWQTSSYSARTRMPCQVNKWPLITSRMPWTFLWNNSFLSYSTSPVFTWTHLVYITRKFE